MTVLAQFNTISLTVLKLTRKDICSALQVPEHRVRAWMDRTPYKLRSTAARKARIFDAIDLVVLAAAQTLEDQYRLRNDGLNMVLPVLNRFLRQPQSHSQTGLLIINITDWSIGYISENSVFIPSLILDIEFERKRIARYLGLTTSQIELPLGLLPVKRFA